MKVARVALLLVLLISLPVGLPFVGHDSVDAAEGACVRTERGYRCTYGPFIVREGENSIALKAAAIPREGFITGARVAMVDAGGRRISGHHIHLHHSDWIDPTTPATLCKYWPGSLIYMSGKERTRMQFPDGYGYYWRNALPEGSAETDPEQTEPYWSFSGMLHGMHAGIEEEVYLRLNLSFRGMRADLTPVLTDFQRATGCSGNPTFDVIKGSGENGRYTTTVRFEWPRDGRFVWGTGHLHDGGLRLSLRNVTRGERILISRAEYEDPSDPWFLTGTTTWSSRRGKAVSAGDILRMRVVYDSTHNWDEVMGNLRISHTE